MFEFQAKFKKNRFSQNRKPREIARATSKSYPKKNNRFFYKYSSKPEDNSKNQFLRTLGSIQKYLAWNIG
ncbi:unnamed protein product, partial [Nesidiocoris tenuis]